MAKTLEQRMKMERDIIGKLIETAFAAGWTIPKVDDGEERVRCANAKDVMDTVFSVDESWIYFNKEERDENGAMRVVGIGTAYIVLGNDGHDCIADNSMGSRFMDEVMDPMDAYCDKLAKGEPA